MPFKDKPTMTTKDQLNPKVTVVSAPSTEERIEEIHNLSDVGADQFVEAGDSSTDVLLQQAKEGAPKSGVDPGEFVGFAPNAPINKMKPEDLNDFMRASVIARPVRLPARLNARSKDPNYRLRWVECKAEDGRRFSDCSAMGFRPAKKEEVFGLDHTLKAGSDGLIRADDLILMIIPCEIIDGYYKHNALSALKMISRQGSRQLAKAEGDRTLRQGISDAGFNPNSASMKDAFGRPKIQIYDPGN